MDEHVKPNFDCRTLSAQEINISKKSEDIRLYKKKIWVVGHQGMVGQALIRNLNPNNNFLCVSRADLDLRKSDQVNQWIENNKPDIIFLSAGKVGGIISNKRYPAEYLYDNLLIAANVINAAHIFKTRKLIYIGSSCIYPKNALQPMTENMLLTGKLEPTNEFYSLGKISGIKLCEAYNKQYKDNFISIVPTNLYGPCDNFNNVSSHVPAALLDRFHNAKIHNRKHVVVWGSGKQHREFMHVDDLAMACIFLAEKYNSADIINVGTGKSISIKDFALKIKNIVSYQGDIIYDTTKPEGSKKKLLSSKKINDLGWYSQIDLDMGLKSFYKWYLSNYQELKR